MERKSFFAKPQRVRDETFALEVQSYEFPKGKPAVVIGRRLFLKEGQAETVRVFLRDVEYNQKGNFKRSEIKDFAAPRKDRQHPGTVPGGILLVQQGIPQADGSFGARWIQPLSHTAGEATVVEAVVHVTPPRARAGNANKKYSFLTIINDGDFSEVSEEMQEHIKYVPPFKVESVEQLHTEIVDLLKAEVGVGVRIGVTDEEGNPGFDALHVPHKRDSNPEDSAREFMTNMAEHAEAIASGAMTCEVIPYSTIWAGPATVDAMEKLGPMKQRVARFNSVETSTKGTEYTVAHFRPAIVAIRLTQPDPQNENKQVPYFSHVEPLNTRYPAIRLDNAIAHAVTEVMAPPVPAPAAPAAQQQRAANDNAAPAKDAGGSAPAQSSGDDFGGPDSTFGDVPTSTDDFFGNEEQPGQDAQRDTPPANDETQAPAAPASRRFAGRRNAG